MHRYLIPIILGVALVSGCAGSYRASATVATSTPDLVYVGPGVYAVADFPDPIFYADNYYWRYYDGYWYRSRHYTGGWGYVPYPPRVIARIDAPYHRYYRVDGRVHVDRRWRAEGRPLPREIREHRSRRVERGRPARVIERR